MNKALKTAHDSHLTGFQTCGLQPPTACFQCPSRSHFLNFLTLLNSHSAVSVHNLSTSSPRTINMVDYQRSSKSRKGVSRSVRKTTVSDAFSSSGSSRSVGTTHTRALGFFGREEELKETAENLTQLLSGEYLSCLNFPSM